MANPTEIVDHPALVEPSGAPVAIILDPTLEYVCCHTGVDSAGAPLADPIFFGYNGPPPAASFAPDSNKGALIDGKTVTIGPGIQEVVFLTGGGSPIISVVPGTWRGLN